MFSLKNGTELQGQIHEWIVKAEHAVEAMESDYTKSREYVENLQVPDDKPKNVDYLIRNLLLDYVWRKMAKMMSKYIEPEIYGVGEMEEPLKELIMEIFEQNELLDVKYEMMVDRFIVEGFTGFKLRWNPYKMGPFGLGFPEIFIGRWDNILLDFGASDGTHLDDNARAWKRRVLVDNAKKEYPGYKDQIYPEGDQQNAGDKGQTCYEYEVEFKKKIYWPHVAIYNDRGQIASYVPVPMAYDEAEDTVQMPQKMSLGKDRIESFLNVAAPWMGKNGIGSMNELYKWIDEGNDIIRIENDIFYRTFVINNKVVVTEPEPTDFRGWSIIDCQHIRKESEDVKVPTSKIPYLISCQDHINIVTSIMHLVIKRNAKSPIFISGGQNATSFEIENDSDVVPIINLDNPEAKVQFPPDRQIPAHLVEWYQLNRNAFDEIGNNMPTERGATEAEFSGRAILALQATGDLADLVPLQHIKAALIQLTNRVVECIINKMSDNPFTIYRKREGEKKVIRYNTYVDSEEDIEKTELEIVQELENSKVINPLKTAMFAKVDVDVEMNVLQKQIAELQKMALVAQDLSREDRLRMAYPKRYKAMLDRKEKEDAAARLIAELSEMGVPVLDMASKMVQAAKGDPDALQSMVSQLQTAAMSGEGGGNGPF